MLEGASPFQLHTDYTSDHTKGQQNTTSGPMDPFWLSPPIGSTVKYAIWSGYSLHISARVFAFQPLLAPFFLFLLVRLPLERGVGVDALIYAVLVDHRLKNRVQ